MPAQEKKSLRDLLELALVLSGRDKQNQLVLFSRSIDAFSDLKEPEDSHRTHRSHAYQPCYPLRNSVDMYKLRHIICWGKSAAPGLQRPIDDSV